MNGNTSLLIRELLLKHPEGLEIKDIQRAVNREYTNVAKRLHATYGCYVMRWNGQRQVWGCMPIPPNAVKPARVPPPPKAKPPKRVRQTTASRVACAEPLTQSVLDDQPAPYIPQKTVWQRVQPWPKEPE